MVKKKATRKPSAKKIDFSKKAYFDLTEDKSYLASPFIDFVQAGSMGKKTIEPKYIIMHYTAGRSFEATVSRFASSDSKVSAHLVVGRDGHVCQMVPFNKPAWHAGADSSYVVSPGENLTHMNFHSIGIELDNYGVLQRDGGGFWRTWFGRYVPAEEVIQDNWNSYWHLYTEEQLFVAEKICALLVRELGVKEILGHSEVKKSKRDPGSAFPMKSFRASVFGRDDVEEEVEERKEGQEEREEGQEVISSEQIEASEPEISVTDR